MTECMYLELLFFKRKHLLVSQLSISQNTHFRTVLKLHPNTQWLLENNEVFG